MAFDPTFTYDNTDDGSRSLPAYLGQALQYYATKNSSPLPSYLSYPLNNQPGQSMFGGGAQFNVPDGALSQAQDPNAQQPDTSTPVAQAMAPQQPDSAPMSQAMSPIQQMFQQQATNPDLSMSNGLIAGGSALLGGKNLQEGLAAAGPAFSDTFDKTLNQQRELNTPKVIPVADGSFSMVQLPGQQPQVMPNSQVQDFLLKRTQLASNAGLWKTILSGQMRGQNQENQQTRAAALAAAPKVTQLDQAIATMDQALDVVNKGRSAGERAAAYAPGIGGAAGYGAQNQILARVGVDSQLAQGAVKAGVVTQGQFEKFETDIPKLTDSDDVWKSFISRNRPFLQSIRDFYQTQVDAGAKAGSGATAPSATGGVLGRTSTAGAAGPVKGNAMSYIQ